MHAGSLTMRGIYLGYRISKKASVLAPSDTQQPPEPSASIPAARTTPNIARRILHECCADASRRLAVRVAQALGN